MHATVIWVGSSFSGYICFPRVLSYMSYRLKLRNYPSGHSAFFWGRCNVVAYRGACNLADRGACVEEVVY